MKKIWLFFLLFPVHAQEPAINPTSIIFHDAHTTLTKIMQLITTQQKGAYIRLGFQELQNAKITDNALGKEMREVYALHGSTILKGISHDFFGWHAAQLTTIAHLSTQPLKEWYSPLALHATAYQDINFCLSFLRFLRKHCSLCIASARIPKQIQALLHNEHTDAITVPSNISYTDLAALERQCLKALSPHSGYTVIVTAGLGIYGPLLQKRLWRSCHDLFLFDMDTFIDLLAGSQPQGWCQPYTLDIQQCMQDLSGDIKIVCTTALLNRTPNDYAQRKQEYEHALTRLAEYGYANPYIVEAIAPAGPTFLDDYSQNVYYTNVNNPALQNKGVNEAQSLIAAFKHIAFNDNDIIVKLTGRYSFYSRKFLDYLEQHPTLDACCMITNNRFVFTGCFALRYKYFKQMLNQIDFTLMEQTNRYIEKEVYTYLLNYAPIEHMRIHFMETVGIEANMNYAFPQPSYALKRY